MKLSVAVSTSARSRSRGIEAQESWRSLKIHDGDTYRAVYTVRFEEVVYVLHSFQKKSKKGIATPKRDLEIVESRLKLAAQHHEERAKGRKGRRT